MKALNYWGMVLLTILVCSNFTSCSNEEGLPDEPTQDKYITVGLGCVGEYLHVSDSPLSRAPGAEMSGGDLYIIQVYTLKEDPTMGPMEDGQVYYREIPYANGEFSNTLSGVTIKLLKGEYYRFKVAIVVGYGMGSSATEFSYSQDYFMSPSGRIQTETEGFYGELDKYIPEENRNVEISTKRVSYAAKFIAQGLTEGHLDIAVSNPSWAGSHRYSVSLTPEMPEHDKIYSFSNVLEAWRGIESPTGSYDPETGKPLYEYKNYTCDKNLNISWTKSNGEVFPLGNYTIKFKRNIRTTIRIKAEELSVSNGITVTREDTPISDDDNEYWIEGGEVITVPMNSGQE